MYRKQNKYGKKEKTRKERKKGNKLNMYIQ